MKLKCVEQTGRVPFLSWNNYRIPWCRILLVPFIWSVVKEMESLTWWMRNRVYFPFYLVTVVVPGCTVLLRTSLGWGTCGLVTVDRAEVLCISGQPGVLQSTGSQRVGHSWATEQQQGRTGHSHSVADYPLYWDKAPLVMSPVLWVNELFQPGWWEQALLLALGENCVPGLFRCSFCRLQ